MDLQTINQRTIVILSAILLAVVVLGGVVYVLLPSKPESAVEKTTEESIANKSFDLGVTQRAGYLRLNTRLIQEGALPVAPPGGVGKANPFL